MNIDDLDLEIVSFASAARQPLDLVVEYALHGGKRSRGLLLCAVGESTEVPTHLLQQSAACVELLHAATLVQDDIFDGGLFRRGRMSVPKLFGNQLATLASDWMLAEAMLRAYRLNADFGEAVALCAQAMMAAEARENRPCRKEDPKILREHVKSIAAGKTGELFALALSAPHRIAGDFKTAGQLQAHGLTLGIAFQYLDDTLDLYGEESKAGKDLNKDFDAGLYTLPIVDVMLILGGLESSSSEGDLHAECNPSSSKSVRDLIHTPSVRQSLLHHAHMQWRCAATACARDLPSASKVPILLRQLLSCMLDEELEPASRTAA